MPDPIFADPRLAAVYDPLDADRSDLGPYLAMLDEFDVSSLVDVGCGTGTFAIAAAGSVRPSLVGVADHGERGGPARRVIGVDPAAASIDVRSARWGPSRSTGSSATLRRWPTTRRRRSPTSW